MASTSSGTLPTNLKFKPGDEVELIDKKGSSYSIGEKLKIIKHYYTPCDGDPLYYVDKTEKTGSAVYESCIKLIKSNNNKMSLNLIQKFKLSRAGEPLKSFVKKGISNIDGSYTTEGKELFNEFLKNKFEADFNTEVVSLIEVEEEK